MYAQIERRVHVFLLCIAASSVLATPILAFDEDAPPESSVLAPEPIPLDAPATLDEAVLADDAVVIDGYSEYDEYVGYKDSCGGSCGVGSSCCTPCESVCCAGPAGNFWLRAEYLAWWTKGMDTPPLVTTGPTGILGEPGTRILYGGDEILEKARSGYRIRLGTWLDCTRRTALEGEYWSLGSIDEFFSASSNAQGVPNLFRPYFDINPRDATGALDPPAREAVELVSTQDELAGTVSVESYSRLQGAGIWLRHNLCCSYGQMMGCDPCLGPCAGPRSSRIDFLLGYRYTRLSDGLTIREDLLSLLAPPEQGAFNIRDTFETSNDFHGLDLGVVSDMTYGRWSLELMGRLALGTVEQVVNISGDTVISGSAANDGTYPGGLLTQVTNIGSYSRNEFAVSPQLSATLGYQISRRIRATVGYNFLYLSRVVRAGDQIDLDVNPDYLAPPTSPIVGAARPHFVFRDTDFWAQGLSVGAECTW